MVEQLFHVVSFRVLDYYFKPSRTKVATTFMHLLTGAFEIVAFSLPFVRIGRSIYEDKEEWYMQLYSSTDWVIFGIYCFSMVVCAGLYFMTNKYDDEKIDNIDRKTDLLPKINETVDDMSDRISPKPEYHCEVTTIDEGKIVLRPEYRRIHYVPKPTETKGGSIKPVPSVPMYPNGIETLLEQKKYIQRVVPVKVSVVNSKAFKDTVEISLKLINKSNEPLRNAEISVSTDCRGAKYYTTNVKKNLYTAIFAANF